MQLNAKARLQAGWWESMSDAAKKAYKKLHPNSKAGKPGSPTPSKPKGSPEDHAKANDEHKAARDAYNAVRDKGGNKRTDAEWAEHDKALDRLERATKRKRELGATVLGALTRLKASSADELQERILRQAKLMDKTPRGSKEYHAQQFTMQRLPEELRRADPNWEDSAFDPLVWSHTGKPPRQSPGLLRADSALEHENTGDDFDGDVDALEDPLSTGVAFDTLIDGEPTAADPAVQVVTRDDGSIEEAPEKELLRDDLVVPDIEFG